MTERERAWEAVHEALPAGWVVGSASHHDERHEWLLDAFDPSERPRIGVRSREWIAVAPTEERVVWEMARCLRELAAGRVPEQAFVRAHP